MLQRAKVRTGKDLLDFIVEKLLWGTKPVVDGGADGNKLGRVSRQ